MRVLLIEDTKNLLDTLVTVLKKANYLVDTAGDGQLGYEYASSDIYDIIILDLMLPKMDGYEVLKKLRRDGNQAPVLVLSARSQIEDKLDAFECGADDYLTKPFEMKELLARIRAIIKRRGKNDIVSLCCGNMELDLATCEMKNRDNGRTIQLAGKEYQMMEIMLYNKNHVLPKEQIIEKVWGYNTDVEYNNVEVYVSFLRRKLAFIQADVRIRVIRGVGYILESVPHEK